MLLFFFFPSFLLAQDKQSVLWEISGNGLVKKSYLFGTYHVASNKTLSQFPQLLSKIKGSDFGLFEIRGETFDGGSSQSRDSSEDCPPLNVVFKADEYKLVDSFFSSTPYGSMRPWNNNASITGMLQVVMTVKGGASTQTMSFDDTLFMIMDDLKKKTYRLDENNDSSRKALNSKCRLIAEIIVELVKDRIDPGSFMQASYADLLVDDMMLNMADSATNWATVRRNLIWLPKIVSKMKDGSCFVAVGLGHLKYETGLIQLLRKEGYALKPVKLEKSN